MPTTGDTCEESGGYVGVCSKNDTHALFRLFDVGDRFYACDVDLCGGKATWQLMHPQPGQKPAQ